MIHLLIITSILALLYSLSYSLPSLTRYYLVHPFTRCTLPHHLVPASGSFFTFSHPLFRMVEIHFIDMDLF
ncbi:uncharacterized protein EDB91DRAFT_1160811 [Suillus paluster]|uniref:uncharacterized protein n=1 Tax=Suillus paluster TaxID=48578 RepID=UPI001B87A67B|nr:uncharacterized protein EDB91DRAFT_1160811 [Suillus paluster]KAG1728719.1 hypothetical protein EDB91DRAFT_1160811 [Suillus paluster]